MKNTIILKIEGQTVDMTEEITFSITKQFKELSNPTNIINDWSKTITIPFTANNNKLFGHIYDPDRKVITSETENIGLYFDPSKKVDFQLLWNNSLMMEGYMKMTSIEKGKGYNVNLFGGLGKVFQELRKLSPTLTETITDEKYLIYPLGMEGFYLNKENIGQSWENARNKYKEMPLTNIIGFTPTNGGYYDSFDSKTIQVGSDSQYTKFYQFTDALKLSKRYDNTIYDVDSLVGDGLLPRQICDYRSYYSQPYMFVDEMFRVLQDKCEELTDYTLNLDSDWFNIDNPYYNDSVMLLKVPEHNAQAQNTYASNCEYISGYNANYPRWSQDTVNELRVLPVTLHNIEGVVKDNEIIVINKNQTLSVKYTLDLTIRLQVDITSFHNIAPGAGLFIKVNFVHPTDPYTYMQSGDYVFISEHNNWPENYYDTYDYLYKVGDSEWKAVGGSGGVSYREVTLHITGEAALKYYKFGEAAKMQVSLIWVPDSSGNVIDYGAIPQGIYLYPAITNTSIINYELAANDNRSYDYITFNELWDNEYNFFDQCLKYTKMFNLIWDVDEINKRINILPLSTYFNNDTSITDWTHKVDFDNNYKIEPLIYDTKYYKLGYEDSEIGLGESYSKKYGNIYGDKIIDTKYNFNEETTNLIEGLKTPIVNTTNVFVWPDMYAANVLYRQCMEPMLCLADNDNNPVNGFGSFLFYKGLKYFTDLGRNICLSDDTQQMQNTHKYSYIESQPSAGGLQVNKYPWLDVIYEGNGYKLGYYFGLPRLKYDATTDYNGMNTIYDICWENYLKEYTSSNNHKLTAYVYLTPSEFIQFKFNKMVKIGNQVYVVNKIFDYSFGERTKCELIRVNDVNNYRHTNLPEPIPPTAKLVLNNMAAADATSQLWCQVETTIENFYKDNIKIVYSDTQHGTLSVASISGGWGTNGYRIFFNQSGFSGNKTGFVQITYYNRRQEKDIVLLTIPWNISISQTDDPVIQTTQGRFMVDSVNVADLTSGMTFAVMTYSYGITQANFEIEKKTGAGTLSVTSFVRTNNNPVITTITVKQSGFTNEGGSGNFIVRINGAIAARIPWHIIINPVSAGSGKIETTKITGTSIETGYKWEDTIFRSGDTLLELNENNELVETDSTTTQLGDVLDKGNGRLVLSFNKDELSNEGITINTSEVKLYKDGYTGNQQMAPGRFPTEINWDNFELADVVE